MRTLVMFDLPITTVNNQKEYRRFRKFLIKSGFIMMQESIYSKLNTNPTTTELLKKSVRKNMPKEGLVQMLTVTEKQFLNMEYLVGGKQTLICDSDSRLIEL